MTTDEHDYPPEMRALSREEFRALYAKVTRAALALTKSEARADQLVSEAFERIRTSRNYPREQGVPLAVFVVQVMKSILSHERKSKASARRNEAHDGYHREVVGFDIPSPEDAFVEHADLQSREAHYAGEYERLAARVAGNERYAAVLRCMLEGIEKAGDIAARLGVPVTQVYDAKEGLKHHLGKMRADAAKGEKDTLPEEIVR